MCRHFLFLITKKKIKNKKIQTDNKKEKSNLSGLREHIHTAVENSRTTAAEMHTHTLAAATTHTQTRVRLYVCVCVCMSTITLLTWNRDS